MIYGYARISSRSQEDGNGLEAQRFELVAAGAERVFEDVFTGMTLDRPQWDELDAMLAPGDTLVVAKLDRIARNGLEGARAVRDLLDRGVSVRVMNIGLIEDTSFGRMMLMVMFAMAEFEHDLIVDRMAAGKEIARQREGYREGRPRAEIDETHFSQLVVEVEEGRTSVRNAAKTLGVSERTFRRRRAEHVGA